MTDRILSELTAGFVALPFEILLLRLVAALLLGGIIGLEREGRGKDAGLRTHMLVAFASCLFLLISQAMADLPFNGASNINVDPLRLVEAVTAGVAFLSAGLIFSRNGSVRNVTTGASMWLAGAIGTACGVGQISLAALAAVLVVAVLTLVGWLEQRYSGDTGETDTSPADERGTREDRDHS